MDKVRIGITIGDINGVGPEVIIKTLSNRKILDMCTPVVYGSSKVISYHKNIAKVDDFYSTSATNAEHLSKNKVNIVNCWDEVVNINLGEATEEGGKYAYISLDRAVRDLKEGWIDALVTAPINKKVMQQAGFPHPGHTEYLAEQFNSKDALMMMVSNEMKIALASTHVPVAKIGEHITKENITRKLKLFNKTLRVDFGIDKPVIAVLGLNPHAGDGGVIGDEETEIIIPVLEDAKNNGVLLMGPLSADGFFGSGEYRKYDGIFAMYHDQGLIPFKALSFGQGVNFTAGLSAVRTSPDHGTAYEIAGKNMADPSSFRQAMFHAIDIARNRISHKEMRENRLKKQPKSSEKV